MSLLSWFRRKVTVEQAHPDYPNVFLILIDSADGSTPGKMLLNRNNFFSLAWVCREFHAAEKGTGPIKGITLTVDIPYEKDGPQIHKLAVPDWAKYKLYAKISELATARGWKGECYHPDPPPIPVNCWKHLLDEDGLD